MLATDALDLVIVPKPSRNSDLASGSGFISPSERRQGQDCYTPQPGQNGDLAQGGGSMLPTGRRDKHIPRPVQSEYESETIDITMSDGVDVGEASVTPPQQPRSHVDLTSESDDDPAEAESDANHLLIWHCTRRSWTRLNARFSWWSEWTMYLFFLAKQFIPLMIKGFIVLTWIWCEALLLLFVTLWLSVTLSLFVTLSFFVTLSQIRTAVSLSYRLLACDAVHRSTCADGVWWRTSFTRIIGRAQTNKGNTNSATLCQNIQARKPAV